MDHNQQYQQIPPQQPDQESAQPPSQPQLQQLGIQQGGRERDRLLSQGNQQKPSGMFAGCCGILVEAFWAFHQWGGTPYAYHTDDERGDDPVHHYNATMFWTTLLVLVGMGAFLGEYGFQKAHDEEYQWWDGVDNFYHQVAAGLALIGIAAAVAGFFGALHAFINCAYHVEGPTTLSKMQFSGTTSGNATVNIPPEDEGLLAIDETVARDGSYQHHSILRLKSSHPLLLLYPPTPAKTFGWTFGLLVAALSITSAVDPNLFFNSLADSDYGHYGAVITAAATAALTAGGLFRAAHVAIGKREEIANKCLRPCS